MGHDNHLQMEDRSKIIVDGAQITCSYATLNASKSQPFVYLRIPCNHGFMENDHLCAHEGNCLAVENIPPFPLCYSPFYRSMLEYLGAFKSQNKELSDAVRIYEGTYPYPCLHSFLDRWMNVNERSMVEDYIDIFLEFDFDPIRTKINQFIEEAYAKSASIHMERVDKGDNIQGSFDEKSDVNNKIEKIKIEKKEIPELLTNFDFSIKDESFSSNRIQINTIWTKLSNLKVFIDQVYSLAPCDTDLYKGLVKDLNNAISETENLYNRMAEFKPKSRRWLTMDSYLICRGGGILTFASNGQEYEEYCVMLLDRISSLVNSFYLDCQDRLDYNRRKYAGTTLYRNKEELDVEEYSYGKAMESLAVYKKMVDGEVSLENEVIKTTVILELVSHSYNQEMGKKLMSLVTVAVTWAGVKELTLFFAAIQFVNAAKTGNLASGYNAQISIDQETMSTMSQKVYQNNNLFSTATAMVDFFTKSEETWIEEIKLNVFCGNTEELKDWPVAVEKDCDFVHTGWCRLDQSGNVAASEFDIQKRGEYIFDGGEWDATMLSKVVVAEHVGEDKVEKEITERQDMGYIINPDVAESARK